MLYSFAARPRRVQKLCVSKDAELLEVGARRRNVCAYQTEQVSGNGKAMVTVIGGDDMHVHN